MNWYFTEFHSGVWGEAPAKIFLKNQDYNPLNRRAIRQLSMGVNLRGNLLSMAEYDVIRPPIGGLRMTTP